MDHSHSVAKWSHYPATTVAYNEFTGVFATVGFTRLVVDNLGLRWSAIAKESCIIPGERSPHVVDADLNYGIDYRYGYSQDACLMTSKREMLARELFLCTFNPLSGDTLERCKANQSLDYHQSFLRGNNTTVQRFSIDSKTGLKDRYEKQCPADCIDERFFYLTVIIHY